MIKKIGLSRLNCNRMKQQLHFLIFSIYFTQSLRFIFSSTVCHISGCSCRDLGIRWVMQQDIEAFWKYVDVYIIVESNEGWQMIASGKALSWLCCGWYTIFGRTKACGCMWVALNIKWQILEFYQVFNDDMEETNLLACIKSFWHEQLVWK